MGSLSLFRKALCVASLLTVEHVLAQPTSGPATSQESTERCVQAHEQAQLARLEGSLTESRRALKSCALETCPTAVQRDCVRWLDELNEQIPTVVFEALTDSGAAQRVRVSHGDRVLVELLDGRPIELDPGYYEFRFELAGQEPKVLSVLLKQGEKNKLVSADFRHVVAPAPAAVAPAPAPYVQPMPPVAREQPAPTTQSTTTRPVPTVVYATAGLALAAAATTAVFGLNTRMLKNEAYEECAPGCSRERIDDIKRSALMTDIALGVAVVSSVASLVLYWQRPSTTTAAARRRPAIYPTLGWQGAGMAAGLGGAF